MRISDWSSDVCSSDLPSRYGSFIGGRWVEPIRGEYFTDHSPINGRQLAEIAKSSPEDVEAALDAAHRAKEGWARMCPAERARILNRVADRLEDKQIGRAPCRERGYRNERNPVGAESIKKKT